MAIPAALTQAVTSLALNGAAIAALVLVARFAVFGVVFLGTPLARFRGLEDDEADYETKPSSEWYVLPAIDKKEVVEPSWERAGEIDEAANDDYMLIEMESGEFVDR